MMFCILFVLFSGVIVVMILFVFVQELLFIVEGESKFLGNIYVFI